jgi:hypothetical protein
MPPLAAGPHDANPTDLSVANPTKGQDYEREICVELSEWWTYGRRSDIFWRTGGSGARATVRAKSHKKTANQDGDITFTDPLGLPFIKTLTIEVKRGYSTKTAYDCTLGLRRRGRCLSTSWL